MSQDNYESLRVALQKLVLPIISTDQGNNHTCIGTGFLPVANGRHAHMVTAPHVMDKLRKLDNTYPRHHPTTPEFFRPVVYRFEIRKTRPQVIYYDADRGAYLASIQAWLEMPKVDLAYCRIAFDDSVPANVQFQARFGLNTTPVKVGDRVIAIGYSKMKVDRIADQNVHSFEAKFNMKITRVRDVFHQTGPTGQGHPCFYVDDALEPGMSGGPVVTVACGGVPHVRGIVRSDETRAADVESEKPIPTALVSMLWPLMLMPVSLLTTSDEIAGRTLLDLQREHLIIDQGNACDRIEFTQSATG
jgi:hypothetical protein